MSITKEDFLGEKMDLDAKTILDFVRLKLSDVKTDTYKKYFN